MSGGSSPLTGTGCFHDRDSDGRRRQGADADLDARRLASANAPGDSAHEVAIPAAPVFRPADADMDKLAEMIEAAKTLAIFGWDGCRDARDGGAGTRPS